MNNQRFLQGRASLPLSTRLRTAFIFTYPPSGYDPVNLVLKGLAPTKEDGKYLSAPLTMGTSFLGLPNGRHDVEQYQQSWRNILYNFFGWQPRASKKRKAFNLFKAVPLALFRIIFAVLTLVLNIVKLVTEFLPYALSEICDVARQRAKAKARRSRHIKKVAGYLAYAAATVGYGFFKAIHFVGRAFTSPVQSVRFAYRDGKGERGRPWRKTRGTALAALSIAATASANLLLLPFVLPFLIKFVADKAITSIVTHMPSSMGIPRHVDKVTKPLGDKLAEGVAERSKLTFGVMTTVELAGDVTVTTTGVVLNKLKRTVSHRRHRDKEEQVVEGPKEYRPVPNRQSFFSVPTSEPDSPSPSPRRYRRKN